MGVEEVEEEEEEGGGRGEETITSFGDGNKVTSSLNMSLSRCTV